ncbi:MAG TPA: glycosyltransferase family 2 protein [Spirochaetales bacterium]|nr:glycosyltransferase family 2 protein [Spirochaetales bacterium]
MPEVSIIVPVYNVEKYIHRCVDSILAQTFTDFECILIDDGSPDNCPAICDEYAQKDSRVKVIHQKNAGVSAARNVGLEAATGKWIGFVDSDDWIENNYIYELIDFNADLVISGYKEYVKNKLFIRTYKYLFLKKNEFFRYFDFFRNTQDLNYILHSPISKLYKKEILLENNIFFDKRISLGEDYIFNLQYFLKCENIIIKPFSSYNYNRIDNSLSNVLSLTKEKIINLLYIVDYTKNYVINNIYIINKKQSYEKYYYTTIYFVLYYGLDIILNDKKLYLLIKKQISIINVFFSRRIIIKIKIPVILFKCNCIFLLKIIIKLYNKLKRIIIQ